MKKVLLILGVSACTTAPVALVANVAPSSDAAACASSKLSSMGYTVESGNKDFGLVKATKLSSSGGDDFVTTVNVALFEEAGVKKMRVTTNLTNHYDHGTKTQELGATKYTQADAQAILDACGAK